MGDLDEKGKLRHGNRWRSFVPCADFLHYFDVPPEATGILAVGGEFHSDEEALLLEDGSTQVDIWGFNIYPAETGEAWIEFDSMIDVPPSANNCTRGVDDEAIRDRIRQVVNSLIVR